MRKSFKGKFLVRKSTLTNGTPVVILCGSFYPNFDTETLNDDDEMWVAELEVKDGGIRFHEKLGGSQVSPEDFLIGEYQSPDSWKNKEQLDLFNPQHGM
jgi:hypothetical protein